jgi:hypothetical protein
MVRRIEVREKHTTWSVVGAVEALTMGERWANGPQKRMGFANGAEDEMKKTCLEGIES